jgi:hypothetical protein
LTPTAAIFTPDAIAEYCHAITIDAIDAAVITISDILLSLIADSADT